MSLPVIELLPDNHIAFTERVESGDLVLLTRLTSALPGVPAIDSPTNKQRMSEYQAMYGEANVVTGGAEFTKTLEDRPIKTYGVYVTAAALTDVQQKDSLASAAEQAA